MKNRFFLIFVFSSICNFIFAQSEFKRALKLNLNYFPNYQNVTSRLDSNIFITQSQVGYQIGFNPAISFQTKKKNYWEFQIIGNFSKRENFIEKPLEKKDSLKYFAGNLNVSKIFGVKSINHIDLLKNRSSKLRLLLSFGYMVGYEDSKNFPYTNLSFDRKIKFLFGEFSFTPRIGYNITNRFYLEFVPPLVLINAELRVGNRFTNNPMVPIKLRTRPIFDLDNQISIINFKYNNFRNSYFNDLISVGFKF